MDNRQKVISRTLDALSIVNAFMPLVEKAMAGKEITDDELKLASARCGTAIQKLDKIISDMEDSENATSSH